MDPSSPLRDDSVTIACARCGQPFVPSGRRRFCSAACRQRAWRQAAEQKRRRPDGTKGCPHLAQAIVTLSSRNGLDGSIRVPFLAAEDRLEFCRGDHAELAVEPAAIEPVDVLQGGVLNIVEAAPRAPVPDEFGLVEAVERLSESIVIAVSL